MNMVGEEVEVHGYDEEAQNEVSWGISSAEQQTKRWQGGDQSYPSSSQYLLLLPNHSVNLDEIVYHAPE
jgi:hypothetical protein